MKNRSRRSIVGTSVAAGGLLVAFAALAGMGIAASASPFVTSLGEAPAVETAQAAELQTQSFTTAPSTSADSATAQGHEVGAGDLAADYNPFTDPNNPSFYTDEMKRVWWGKESVVKKCMQEKGLKYKTARPWHEESAQPTGLSYAESMEWLDGYFGEGYSAAVGPASVTGCAQLWEQMDSGAVEIPDVQLPRDVAPEQTQREVWLAHDAIVRDCMQEKGVEYLYWEWWNPVYNPPFDPFSPEPVIPAAQPLGLSEEQIAAWDLALYGDAGLGADYRWEDAGCAGYATHVTGNDNMH